jgi:hypothetical protein
MNRRDLFRSIAGAFVAAMLPAPLRRLTVDPDTEWFAEVPLPEGWAVLDWRITRLLHSDDLPTWSVLTGRHAGGGGHRAPWIVMYGADIAETRTYTGTMAVFPSDRHQVILREPDDGVLRIGLVERLPPPVVGGSGWFVPHAHRSWEG